MNGYQVTARIDVSADSIREAVIVVENLRTRYGGPGPSVDRFVVTGVIQTTATAPKRSDDYVGPYGSGGPGPYE